MPPNWDSWGKIRVLREGFDVEAVSQGWSIDLESKFPPPGRHAINTENGDANGNANGVEYDTDGYEIADGSAVTMFEASIRNPTHDALQMAGRDTHSTKLEVETLDTQSFLGAQVTKLETFKQKIVEEEDKKSQDERAKGKGAKAIKDVDDDGKRADVTDHIGPVQFNVGGIQVDADDMVKRLQVSVLAASWKAHMKYADTIVFQDRQTYGSSPEPESPVEETADQQQPIDTENLQNFFTNLMNRKGPGAKNGA